VLYGRTADEMLETRWPSLASCLRSLPAALACDRDDLRDAVAVPVDQLLIAARAEPDNDQRVSITAAGEGRAPMAGRYGLATRAAGHPTILPLTTPPQGGRADEAGSQKEIHHRDGFGAPDALRRGRLSYQRRIRRLSQQ
jgi:hypothetical protein